MLTVVRSHPKERVPTRLRSHPESSKLFHLGKVSDGSSSGGLRQIDEALRFIIALVFPQHQQ